MGMIIKDRLLRRKLVIETPGRLGPQQKIIVNEHLCHRGATLPTSPRSRNP